MSSRLPVLIVGIVVASLAHPSPARPDFVRLRTGGEIRGEFDRDSKGKETALFSMRTLNGARLVVLRDDVDSVIRRRVAVEHFELRRAVTAEDIDALWELSEWCRTHSLKEQREQTLARIVELDPAHAAAHRGLGHAQYDGRWSTRDEIMTSRGYIKHKGKWVLPQELELIVRDEQDGDAVKGWYKRINMWHRWLSDDRSGRASEALSELRGIRDGNAVPALQKAFSNDANESMRMMYVNLLGGIDDDRSVGPLIVQSLRDDSDQVRIAAVRGISRERKGKAILVYYRALKHDLNVVVNRAAAALGMIGDEQVVPQLIDALVTRHKYRMLVSDPGMSVGVATSNGSMVPANSVPIPPDIGVALLTGQLPYGMQVNVVPPPQLEPQRKEMIVQKDEQNSEVLLALQTLTHQNLGFDKSSWKAWYKSHKAALLQPAGK